ncbi:hemagglutinin repeat-containing protein, partial [Rosenbergiella nectarea]
MLSPLHSDVSGSLTHQETTLDSGGQVTLHSGRDTTL